ncbi:hypothetical protein Tco_1495808, partial [Tanacetum coccineum]
MPRAARNGEAGTSKMVGCEINKSATVHLEVKVIECMMLEFFLTSLLAIEVLGVTTPASIPKICHYNLMGFMFDFVINELDWHVWFQLNL